MFRDIKGLEREMGLGLGVYREKVTREIMGLGFREREIEIEIGVCIFRERYILGVKVVDR